jgi:hypothetical protein
VVSDELFDDCTSDRDVIFERSYPKCKFIAGDYDVKLINKPFELLLLGRSVVWVLILESNQKCHHTNPKICVLLLLPLKVSEKYEVVHSHANRNKNK